MFDGVYNSLVHDVPADPQQAAFAAIAAAMQAQAEDACETGRLDLGHVDPPQEAQALPTAPQKQTLDASFYPAQVRIIEHMARHEGCDTVADWLMHAMEDHLNRVKYSSDPTLLQLQRDLRDENVAVDQGAWLASLGAKTVGFDLFRGDECTLPELSGRLADELHRLGVVKLGHLLVLTIDQLEGLRGIGSSSVSRLVDVLTARGLRLRPHRCDPPGWMEGFAKRKRMAKLCGQWLTLEDIAEVGGVSVAKVRRRMGGGETPEEAIRLLRVRKPMPTPKKPSVRISILHQCPPPSDLRDERAAARWYAELVWRRMQGTAQDHFDYRIAIDGSAQVFKRIYGATPSARIRTLAGIGKRQGGAKWRPPKALRRYQEPIEEQDEAEEVEAQAEDEIEEESEPAETTQHVEEPRPTISLTSRILSSVDQSAKSAKQVHAMTGGQLGSVRAILSILYRKGLVCRTDAGYTSASLQVAQ
jgi:hypothetical protein